MLSLFGKDTLSMSMWEHSAFSRLWESSHENDAQSRPFRSYYVLTIASFQLALFLLMSHCISADANTKPVKPCQVTASFLTTSACYFQVPVIISGYNLFGQGFAFLTPVFHAQSFRPTKVDPCCRSDWAGQVVRKCENRTEPIGRQHGEKNWGGGVWQLSLPTSQLVAGFHSGNYHTCWIKKNLNVLISTSELQARFVYVTKLHSTSAVPPCSTEECHIMCTNEDTAVSTH